MTTISLLTACALQTPQSPEQALTPAGPAPTSARDQAPDLFATLPPAAAGPSAGAEQGTPIIVVETNSASLPFDRRLLGTNLAAWVGPERLAEEQPQARVRALGPTLVRLPGGSWSNAYDWLACERGEEGCYWPWAARPSDFLSFLRATGQEASWTVSINGTAKEAAALVAFFNGDVDDETEIGVDVRGRDWETVGHWARLRAAGGSPAPLPIRLWEVGNEVYGGKPEGGGAECAPWGWEDVWTCDGTEYVYGKGEGATRHEGYLEFRAAMRAVDPTILVGAVGVPIAEEWGDWGNEVIAAAGDQLDFYSIHHYAFSETPEGAARALDRPQQIWPEVARSLEAAFQRHAGGRRVPVAVTEYNLVAFQELDEDALMRRAVNALFIADSIGQMALAGVTMANQWNLANGVAENNTDYGMIDAETYEPNPQYYALALWQRFGDELLPVRSPLSAATELSVYAGRSADGTLTLLAINKTGREIVANVQIDPAPGPLSGTRDELRADSLETTEVVFNGVARPADLADAPPESVGPFSGSFEQRFAPYSITALRLSPLP